MSNSLWGWTWCPRHSLAQQRLPTVLREPRCTLEKASEPLFDGESYAPLETSATLGSLPSRQWPPSRLSTACFLSSGTMKSSVQNSCGLVGSCSSSGLRVPLPWKRTGRPGKLGCLGVWSDVATPGVWLSVPAAWDQLTLPNTTTNSLKTAKRQAGVSALNQASDPVWASCFTQKTGTGLALIKASEHVRSGICEGRLTMNCPAHSSFNAQRSIRPCQAGF